MQEVAVDAVLAGDVVVVRSGEVVPVDGIVASATRDDRRVGADGRAAAGRRARRGDPVRSGTANAGEAFDLRATRRPSESAYAAIVRLVAARPSTSARPSCAWPIATRPSCCRSRCCSPAAPGRSAGDAVRALAVLVVATPCPLILAAPIALVSGVSRAARVGIVVKGAGVIEQLGRVAHGAARQDRDADARRAGGRARRRARRRAAPDELLRLAASVDELSAHVVAEALVHDAEARGLVLAEARDVHEQPGDGIEGAVEGRRVAVGSRGFLRGAASALDGEASRRCTRRAARGSASPSTDGWPDRS